MLVSSPRTWGCFQPRRQRQAPTRVFPTHVGVFPVFHPHHQRQDCLPHARGGVSTSLPRLKPTGRSSPRTWGCFPTGRQGTVRETVFPTHVGVFLDDMMTDEYCQSLPHARGGVSKKPSLPLPFRGSSPRTWGCFSPVDTIAATGLVFPTHVGVFPTTRPMLPPSVRLPHARGGVSPGRIQPSVWSSSSPRTWGCFLSGGTELFDISVFPTHVGVFPMTIAVTENDGGLPHARGGVSPQLAVTAIP